MKIFNRSTLQFSLLATRVASRLSNGMGLNVRRTCVDLFEKCDIENQRLHLDPAAETFLREFERSRTVGLPGPSSFGVSTRLRAAASW
jgi:hypothetical protein